jgi:proline iminopeptidase
MICLTSFVMGQAATSPPQSIHPAGDYANLKGTRIWYESEGSGPPLLLIAGGPGLSHGYLHPHFSQLARWYRVIYFDAFGTGKSDEAQDPHEYTFARDVENIETLRTVLELGKINVLGHSYGGMVAQAYAARFPDAVQSLILVDTSWGAEMSLAHIENEHNELKNQYPETWEKELSAHERGLHSCSKEFQEAADETREFSASMLFFDPLQIEKLVQTGGPPNRKVTCSIRGDDADFVLGGDFAKLDLRPQLKGLRMPVLIVAGRFDRILIPRFQLQFKTFAPDAQFVMFEKSGHFPFIEEPEKFTNLVHGFLQRSVPAQEP